MQNYRNRSCEHFYHEKEAIPTRMNILDRQTDRRKHGRPDTEEERTGQSYMLTYRETRGVSKERRQIANRQTQIDRAKQE